MAGFANFAAFGEQATPVQQSPSSFAFDDQTIVALESLDKQQLAVFQWLAALERDVASASLDIVKASQKNLERQLFKFFHPSTAVTKVTATLRRHIATVLVQLYTYGETRTAFDTMTMCQGFLNSKEKLAKDDTAIISCKLLGVTVLGCLSEKFGARFLSLFSETATIFIKFLKAQSDPSAKVETLAALTATIRGGGRGMTELIFKDLYKCLKSMLTEKHHRIRDHAAKCLLSIVKYSSYLQPVNLTDAESFIAITIKAFEATVYCDRMSVAQLIGYYASLTQQVATLSTGSPSRNHTKKIKSVFKSKDNNGTTTVGGGTEHNEETVDNSALDNTTICTPEEMLSLLATGLSKYHARDIRVGIFESYSALFATLGPTYIETYYPEIIHHFATGILGNPKILSIPRPEFIAVRSMMSWVLRSVIGRRMLSEEGQLSAARHLIEHYLCKWPAKSIETPSSKWTLTVLLYELGGLITDLSGSANVLHDILLEPILTLLGHPSHSVQIAAAWSLRRVCLSIAAHLPTVTTQLLTSMQRDIQTLSGSVYSAEVLKRCVGQAYGLAAVLSAARHRPIYVSFETTAKVLAFALQLMKNAHPSAYRDIRTSICVNHVAWMILTGLMAAGPTFVKMHLSQVFLLWKAAFPKLTGSIPGLKAEKEWFQYVHSKELALASLHTFLCHNESLLSADVLKRVATFLNHALIISTLLPKSSSITATSNTIPPSSSSSPFFPVTCRYVDIDFLFRKRLYDCITCLEPMSVFEPSFSHTVRLAVDTFAGDSAEPQKVYYLPPPYVNYGTFGTQPTGMSAGVSNWSSVEFGVTALLRRVGSDIKLGAGLSANNQQRSGTGGMNARHADADFWNLGLLQDLEEKLYHPIVSSYEYDPLCILSTQEGEETSSGGGDASTATSAIYILPIPPTYALVDASIKVFVRIFLYLSSKVQEELLDMFGKTIRQKQDKPGRKIAVQLNILIVLYGIAHEYATIRGSKKAEGTQKLTLLSTKSSGMIWELVQPCFGSADPMVRDLAANTVGVMTNVVGSQAVAAFIPAIVDQIVNNRDPCYRAGFALALSRIVEHCSNLVSTAHLKTAVGILHSLATDAHPVVHTYALQGIWLLIESAGLNFSPFVTSTLAVAAKAVLSDEHSPWGSQTNSFSGLCDVGRNVGRIVYSCVGVLGPELRVSTRVRELSSDIVHHLLADSDELYAITEALRCFQNFILLAPDKFPAADMVPLLQRYLGSEVELQQQKVAITCVWQLVQREPSTVLMYANELLEEQMFAIVDSAHDYDVFDDVRKILSALVERTGAISPTRWINLARFMLTKQNIQEVPQQTDHTSGGETDEDPDTIRVGNTDAAPKTTDGIHRFVPRWHSQLTALKCLRQMIAMIKDSPNAKQHLDLAAARESVHTKRKSKHQSVDFLIFKVPDLIKLAFTATTTASHDIRTEGLGVLEDILDNFAATPDPDYAGHALLEQYQAQFTSALAPAFAVDSSPMILARACQVCSQYIGSGITEELYTLSRIIQQLRNQLNLLQTTGAVENTADDSTTIVQPQSEMSQHAKVIVRLAVLTAWADLRVISFKHCYINEIVEPHIKTLLPMWISAIKEYVLIKVEPGFTSTLVKLDHIDGLYSASTRGVLLPCYARAWPSILNALSTFIANGDKLVMNIVKANGNLTADTTISGSQLAMNEQSITGSQINKLFVILFGLCLEPFMNTRENSDRVLQTCLLSLKAILRPEFMGCPFLEKNLLRDMSYAFERILQTEGPEMQLIVIEITHQLVNTCLNTDGELTIDYLRPLLNIFYKVLIINMPHLSVDPIAFMFYQQREDKQKISMLLLALESLHLLTKANVCCKDRAALQTLTLATLEALLHDSIPQEIASRCLIVLKDLVTQTSTSSNDASPSVNAMMSLTAGLLESILQTLDDEDVNENWRMIENALLAITILITSHPVDFAQSPIPKTLLDIFTRIWLLDTAQPLVSALQCLRSLSSLASHEDPHAKRLGKTFAAYAVPQLMVNLQLYISKGSNKLDDSYIELMLNTALALLGVCGDTTKQHLLTLLLPSLIGCLQMLSTVSPKTYNTTLTHILGIAGNPVLLPNFKTIVSLLPATAKHTLETSLRSGVKSA